MSASELPAGWQRVRFGDVVRKVNDRVDPETAGIDRYVAGEHMNTDDLRIRRWGEVGDGYLGPAFQMKFQPGQVLYGSRRTYLRKVAVPDFEGICANTTFVLEPSSDSLLPNFLPLVMTTERFHEHSIKQSKGSVNPYINFSDLAWFEFSLPPKEEQQRLAGLVVSVDRARWATERVDADSLMRSALVELLAKSEETVSVGDVLSLEYGKGLGAPARDGGRYPVIGSAGVVGHHSVPLVSDDCTVVVGRKGTAGHVQLVEGPCWPIDTTYFVRPRVEVPSAFIAVQLRHLNLAGLSVQTAMPGLNRDDVYRLPFRLPSSVSVKAFLEKLHAAQDLAHAVEHHRKRYSTLRTSVLDQLTGSF